MISYIDETTGSEILVMPSDDYQVTAMVDFGTKVLGTQNATLKSMNDFKTEIADARIETPFAGSQRARRRGAP